MTDLLVAPCSHEAATLAVTRWHYSHQIPTGKIVRLGVWEHERFIGAVLFSRGASPYLGDAYDLGPTELCELTRVALRDHDAPVTQIVAWALRILRERNPGLRLVVSFADPARGHLGGIYQAGNWIYTGLSNPVLEHFVRGRWRHVRGSYHEVKAAGGRVPTRTRPGKHRYLMPLDRAMRRQVAPLALPFPRGRGLEGEPASDQEEGAGSIPAGRSA